MEFYVSTDSESYGIRPTIDWLTVIKNPSPDTLRAITIGSRIGEWMMVDSIGNIWDAWDFAMPLADTVIIFPFDSLVSTFTTSYGLYFPLPTGTYYGLFRPFSSSNPSDMNNPFLFDSTRIWFTNPVNDWPLESDSMNLAILVVDYQDYNFEGGHFSIHAPCQNCTVDSLPFTVIINQPGDFGDITFLYNYSLDTLFFATIIWMGTGQIMYPENFLPPDSFTVTTDSINEPNAFKYFDYWQIWDPIEYQARIDTAWQVVNKLDITGQISINDYYIGAYLYAPAIGAFDPNPTKWIFFLYQDLTRGNVSITDEETLPKDLLLYQNYPNPFNPVTTIEYHLPVEAEVQITIYNIAGQAVGELINEVRPAGIHKLNFDATTLASGMYFYRIETAGFSQTHKMILLK